MVGAKGIVISQRPTVDLMRRRWLINLISHRRLSGIAVPFTPCNPCDLRRDNVLLAC
jgi:hypothetical protein